MVGVGPGRGPRRQRHRDRASANVVVTGIAAREGHPISFGTFTRYGIVVTTVTVLIAWPYLWLRYFVLA